MRYSIGHIGIMGALAAARLIRSADQSATPVRKVAITAPPPPAPPPAESRQVMRARQRAEAKRNR